MSQPAQQSRLELTDPLCASVLPARCYVRRVSGPTKPLSTKPLPPPGGRQADPSKPPRFELRVMSGAETGACIVTDSRVVIGSAPEAHFQVRDDSVSRNHVEVVVKPEGARVTDLGSTNGTF